MSPCKRLFSFHSAHRRRQMITRLSSPTLFEAHIQPFRAAQETFSFTDPCCPNANPQPRERRVGRPVRRSRLETVAWLTPWRCGSADRMARAETTHHRSYYPPAHAHPSFISGRTGCEFSGTWCGAAAHRRGGQSGPPEWSFGAMVGIGCDPLTGIKSELWHRLRHGRRGEAPLRRTCLERRTVNRTCEALGRSAIGPPMTLLRPKRRQRPPHPEKDQGRCGRLGWEFHDD